MLSQPHRSHVREALLIKPPPTASGRDITRESAPKAAVQLPELLFPPQAAGHQTHTRLKHLDNLTQLKKRLKTMNPKISTQSQFPAHIYPRQFTEQMEYIGSDVIKIDASANDYYSTTTTNEGTTQEEVIVTAMFLVISHGSNFAQSFNGRQLKKLTIVADKISLQTPIHLPGTDLTIYARDISIGENSYFSTEPEAYPAPAKQFKDGGPPRNGGNISIYAGKLNTTSKGAILKTNGAPGQEAGPGQAGKDGDTCVGWKQSRLGFISGAFQGSHNNTLAQSTAQSLSDRLWRDPGNKLNDIVEINYQAPFFPAAVHNHTWKTQGKTSNGWKPTQVAGKPGTGGDGGSISANVAIESGWAEIKGGKSAKKIITKGGKAGFVIGGAFGDYKGPGAVATTISTFHPSILGGLVGSHYTYSIQSVTPNPACKPGEDDPGKEPDKPKGNDGKIQKHGLPGLWLHPLHIPSYLRLINDARLNNDLETATYYLVQIIDGLNKWLSAKSGKNIEQIPTFSSALETFNAIDVELNRKLDYFGNPAGWTPTLSLDQNMAVYNAEIDRALPVIYMAEWFEAYAKKVDDKKKNYTHAISQIEKQRVQDGQEFAKLQKEISPLQTQINDLSSRIKVFQKALKKEEAQLRKTAKLEVWSEHLLKIASAVCSLIPVGQPELGMAGAALNTVSNYMVGKDPTVANVGEDLLSGLSTVSKYGLNQRASGIEAALKKKPPATSTPEAASKAKVKNLRAAAGNLGEFTGTVTKQFKALYASKDEINQQLAKLEQSDPLFQELAKQLQTLNSHKESLFQRLNSILSLLSKLSGRISQSYLDEIHLYDEISSKEDQISEVTRHIIKGMRQDAMSTLQRFQYYLLKSYEYQMLATMNGVDLRLEKVVSEIQTVIKKSGSKQPYAASKNDYDPIKVYLQGVYDEILTNLIHKIESPQSGSIGFNQISDTRNYVLTSNELAMLNNDDIGQVAINLFDKNIVKIEEENSRIVDLKVKTISGTAIGTGSNQTCRIAVQFFGEGILRNSGTLYSIRAYNENQISNRQRDFVREWSSTYNQASKKTIPDKPSIRTAELVSTLLNNQKKRLDQQHSGKPKPLNSRLYDPPAWSELVVRRMDNWLHVDQIELELKVSFQDQPTGGIPLAIKADDESSGPIWLGSGHKIKQVLTSSFDVYGSQDSVMLRPGYFGNKMATGLLDVSIPSNAKPIGGSPPWKLTMPVGGGQKLQLQLTKAIYSPPLQAPREWGWSTNRDYLNQHKPAKPQNWQLHGGVQYALSFVDKNNKETLLGPWSEEISSEYYIFPILCDIWHDPSGTAVARRLYRRFIDQRGKIWPQERVNTTDNKGKDLLGNNEILREFVDRNL